MDGYQPGRRDLLRAAFDAAERELTGPPASVLDVGAGPGTTAEAVLRKWPDAQVTLLDVDPVLTSLARTALPAARVRYADLRTPAWSSAAGGPYDLVLVVMTLHYFPEPRAAQLYQEIRPLVRPSGMLLVADTVTDTQDDAGAATGADDPADDPADAGHRDGGRETAWSRWWAEIAADPAMARVLDRRARVLARMVSAEFVAGPSWHRHAARRAGFGTGRTVWSRGHQALLAFTDPASPS